MSAPTPAPGDDRPREGYYPDPSIPGYVRYWNGAAWVPGTSRPAPADGERCPPARRGRGARGSRAAARGARRRRPGPIFFDEEPTPRRGRRRLRRPAADAQHGARPEPASAWGADASRQTGFGGEQDQRVSWGAPRAGRSAGPSASRRRTPARRSRSPRLAPAEQPSPRRLRRRAQGPAR